jgi:hypothetical protein
MESLPQYGEIQSFLKSVSVARIFKMRRFQPEYEVQRQSFNMEVVEKFILMRIGIKFVQNGVHI